MALIVLTIPFEPAEAQVFSACEKRCQSDYDDAAAACGKMQDQGQKRACQDGAYASYESCRAGCGQKSHGDCKERCKAQCDKVYNRCRDDCYKNDNTRSCYSRCMDEYAPCLRECDKDCD